jgi:hypothetical protein
MTLQILLQKKKKDKSKKEHIVVCVCGARLNSSITTCAGQDGKTKAPQK